MDNVTHTLFALTLARTRLGRGGRGTTAALVLASNAPDIDIVTALGGTANYLQWHRGPTHGPLGVIGLALLTAALAWGGEKFIQRRAEGIGQRADDQGQRTDDQGQRADDQGQRAEGGGQRAEGGGQRAEGGGQRADPAPFSTLLGVSMIGVLLHILMDLPTSYGTRLLSPFSWRWFAIDLMPIIDVYLWIILAAGLVAGSLWRSAGPRIAVIALALMAANYGIRVAAHQGALATAAQVYGPTVPAPCDPSARFGSLLDSWPHAGGAGCLVDTAAIPSFGSPFEWRVIAQLPDEYLEIYRDDAARIPNRWTPHSIAAARTRTAQVLLGFSRFPVVREFPQPAGGATVQFTDLRFAMGPATRQLQARRSALFTATVRVGPDNEILEERLGE
jgi:membrane-bound metal-dependent hydrolase YbcI (DUF457 family)